MASGSQRIPSSFPRITIPAPDRLPLYQAGSTKKGIQIEDNVWIGAGVRILDGVRIGRNTIVGAGSVVSRSLPPNVTAVGAPARPTKLREPPECHVLP